jgi:hypothetical protein
MLQYRLMQPFLPIFQAPLAIPPHSLTDTPTEQRIGTRHYSTRIRSATFVPSRQDEDILVALAHYQLLSTGQISDLLFPPTGVMNKQGRVVVEARKLPVSRWAKARLAKLSQAGYIYWIEQPRLRKESRPFVAFFTKKGADYVRQLTDLPEELLQVIRSKEAGGLPYTLFTMRHRFLINDFRIRLVKELERTGFTLIDAVDERTMRRTHKNVKVSYQLDDVDFYDKWVVPDWYCMLNAWKRPFSFVLEIDTGSEAGETRKLDRHSTYSHKIAAYLQWFNRRAWGRTSPAERLYPDTQGKTRVLTITSGEGRLAHLKQITERLGGLGRFWLTTFDRLAEADSLLLSPVWSVASMTELRPLLIDPS